MHFDSSDSVSPFMTLINMRNANENVGRNMAAVTLELKKRAKQTESSNRGYMKAI